MKNLRSLFALCALAFTLLVSARADSVPLEQVYFYTDNATDVEELEDAYSISSNKYGTNYSFAVSYDFATGLDLAGVEFSMWFFDSADEFEVGDYIEGPGRDGGQGLSWLDGSIDIPSELTGTITVGVVFTFTDGTQLMEYLTHEID